MTADLSVLMMPGGTSRMTCVGCTKLLHEKGMLNLESDYEIGNAGIRVRVYSIKEGFTLSECRETVGKWHVPSAGNPLNSDGRH